LFNSSSVGSVQIIVFGNRVPVAVITDELFYEKNLRYGGLLRIWPLFAVCACVCVCVCVCVWKITVRTLTGRPRINSLDLAVDNDGRFVIDYAHVMHLVTVIV